MFAVLLACACSIGLSPSASEPADDPTLPKCPPDWKIEVLLQQPKLIHPSTVCTAPDGRVFVAQDPIDMGLPSNATADSILCLHPDGQITLFATNLHAVFGLAYVDGKVFVHHTPQFSVFTDDNGVGKDRVDLFTTNPSPSLDGRGFNDHVPSNMRLGMDGWFYMSTGDKGIYGAVGRDGSKVNLEGGGVMRFRPDGTHLEIYANGTRNHLDVAINSEDELFSYDNTDDGNGWWTRVTHMVDGGFYGYPYNYKPRRPYTLWMMTDYGGGSPTGAIAYNEDALPEEYRGNLFLSEWGRRQLLRLQVSRSGATYKIDSRVQISGRDFLTAGTKEFRPVGLAFSPDGLSLYIADWNYGGWKANVVAGRLLKLTYTGKSMAAPKPIWWQAAAMGKNFQATTDALIEGLKHPAQNVRLVAQRRLADRGQSAVPQLESLLKDSRTPPHARWHAIWALDAIDGGVSSRASILAAATKDKDVSVRAQAIRQLGTRRAPEAVGALAAALKDAEAEIRFRAATALGRIGDPSAVTALTQGLDENDFFTRYAVFTALNHIGRAAPTAWEEIGRGLESSNPAIREGTQFAMRETFDERNVKTLSSFVGSKKEAPETRAAALGVLAELHHQRPAWAGRWWGTQPVKGSPQPKTLEWPGTTAVLAAIRSALADADQIVRRAAIDAAVTASDASAAPLLSEMFWRENDVETKQKIVHALGELKDESAGQFVANLLSDPKKNQALLAEAITAAGRIGGKQANDALIHLVQSPVETETLALAIKALGNSKNSDAAPVVARLLSRPDATIQSSAGEALASIGGQAAWNALSPYLDDPNPSVQKSAIVASGSIRNREAVPKLLALYQNAGTRTPARDALIKMSDLRALDVYLAALNESDSFVREASRRAIESFRDRALPEIEAKHREKPFTGPALNALQRVYSRSDRAHQGPLFEGDAKPSSPADYLKYVESHSGAANRGRQIFESQTVGCAVCHRVGGKGGEVGPDLTGIATKYKRETLIESVLYPSKQILDGYKSIVISTKDGESYTGFIRDENPKDLTLVDATAQKHVIRKDQVSRRQESNLSLMPEGIQSTMSLAEFTDLIEFLESQKQ